jgi:hypothetical protein
LAKKMEFPSHFVQIRRLIKRKAEKLLGNFDDFSLSPLSSLIFLEGKTIFPLTPRRGERGKTKKSSGLKKVVKHSGTKLLMCTGS